MLLERVLSEAKPILEKLIVKDAVIGISLIGIQLDNNTIGSAYVLREDLPGGCSIFPYSKEIISENAYTIAKWALEGENILKRALGIAVLNAGSASFSLKNAEKKDGVFSINIKPEDTVGMVGYIAPAVKSILEITDKLFVFDKGKTHENVYPLEEQEKILSICDIVFMSGTTFINHTIDSLLLKCKNAKEIVIVGSSTPMYPECFKNTNVTVLAGTQWKKEAKNELFKRISLGAGIQDVSEFMEKLSIVI